MVRRSFMSFLIVAGLLVARPVLAQWSLDNDQSTVSFVTIKADHVAEVHTFDALSGHISASGEVDIVIELASVNTLIPIRNERMREMLFETNLFPEARISSQVEVADLRALNVGESRTLNLEVTLDMHGVVKNYPAVVRVARGNEGVVATTLKPIVVTAEDHGLVTGVEALREVAGLPSISRAVPVIFTVVFE